VYQFNYEEKATIEHKKPGTTDIYHAKIPVGRNRFMNSLVIGDNKNGFFSSDELENSGANIKEINIFFSKAMTVVTKYMSTYLQKIVFFPNETRIRFIDDSSVVLEFHNIPREIFESLSNEHLRLLGESEKLTVFNTPESASKKTVSKKRK
jgi:hypothetical protein